MNAPKTVIALDVDGVIADVGTPVFDVATRILRRELPRPEHWHSYSFSESMQLSDEETKYVFDQIEREDSLPYRVQLYPGAAEFVRKLRLQSGVEVYFLTAPWPRLRSWVVARDELLGITFPTVEVVYTHAKRRARFDLLIDDRVATVCEPEIRDRAWLFSRPWNKSFDDKLAGVARVSGYSEILELVT